MLSVEFVGERKAAAESVETDVPGCDWLTRSVSSCVGCALSLLSVVPGIAVEGALVFPSSLSVVLSPVPDASSG